MDAPTAVPHASAAGIETMGAAVTAVAEVTAVITPVVAAAVVVVVEEEDDDDDDDDDDNDEGFLSLGGSSALSLTLIALGNSWYSSPATVPRLTPRDKLPTKAYLKRANQCSAVQYSA